MYTRRLVTPLEPLLVGPTVLKMYGLSAQQRVPAAELLVAARALAVKEILRQRPLGEAGFVIIHEAKPAQFVLIHVWQGVDLRQLYFTSPLHAPTQFSPFEQETIGCVWELGIINYERNAWIQHVLSKTPADKQRYLTDRCSGQV